MQIQLNYLKFSQEISFDHFKAIDFQILQKILPKIYGNTNKVRYILLKLLKYCVDDLPENIEEKEIKKLALSGYLPRSASKIIKMIEAYDENGFTSFWE